MKKILINKPLGKTPLQAIQDFVAKNPGYKDKKIGYAGRLDPMAEGLLLCLVGDENKKINSYMKKDKEYVAEILVGFKSDSYDLLGIAEKSEEIALDELKNKIKKLKGWKLQELPSYSSFIIKSKPLFYYARKNMLPAKLPRKKIKIKKIKLLEIKKIRASRLLKEVLRRISLVGGDFRQAKIKKKWNSLLKKDSQEYLILKLKIRCSSGTYIRSIANNDLNSCLFSLKRTQVGRFGLRN